MKTINTLFVLLVTIGMSIFSAQSQTARLQVIHNSADAAASQVDVYLNGGLLLDDFGFRTATPFIDAPAGVPLQIGVAGAASMSANDTIRNFDLTLSAGGTYIVVANGIVSPSGYSPAEPFSLHVYAMGREASLNPSNTDVLVFHGATDAPIVDAVETHFPAGTIIDNLGLNQFSGYASLPATDYILNITDDTQSSTVVRYRTPLGTLNLGGGAITVVASGFLNPSANSNGAAFGLFVALPAGGNLIPLPQVSYSQLQVIHNSADIAAGVVDVYRNNELLIDNFEFRTASPFVEIASDINHVIGIAPASSMSASEAIATFDVSTMAGEKYIAIANGIVSPTGYNPSVPFDLHIFAGARTEATSSSNTDVLVFHGATDAPAVDVIESLKGAGLLVDDASLHQFAGYLELPTDDYVLDVKTADQSVLVARYQAPLQTLMLDGASLVVVASGFLNPSQNSNGAAFGLYVALPAGGDLIPLPSISTGIDDQSNLNLNVYPNPGSSTVYLDLALEGNNSVDLFLLDQTGRKIRDYGSVDVMDNARKTIDISDVPSGTYFLKFRYADYFETHPLTIVR